jgi:hypothetical protein
LIVRRLSGRAWGSIGILAALVITLAMIWSVPQPSVARQVAGMGPDMMQVDSGDRPSPPEPYANAPPILAVSHTAARESSPAGQQDTADADSPNQRLAPPESLQARDSNWPVADTEDRDDAAGARAGRSFDGQAQPLRLADRNRSVAGRDNAADSSGLGATDAGEQAAVNPDARAGNSGRAGNESGAAGVLPWRSASWSADCAAAMQALHSGRVPDACRELVRAYFDPRETSEPAGTSAADHLQAAR